MELKAPLLLNVKHQVSSIQILHNEEQMILLTSLTGHFVDVSPESWSGDKAEPPLSDYLGLESGEKVREERVFPG